MLRGSCWLAAASSSRSGQINPPSALTAAADFFTLSTREKKTGSVMLAEELCSIGISVWKYGCRANVVLFAARVPDQPADHSPDAAAVSEAFLAVAGTPRGTGCFCSTNPHGFRVARGWDGAGYGLRWSVAPDLFPVSRGLDEPEPHQPGHSLDGPDRKSVV